MIGEYVSQVAGNNVNLTILMPPEANPHTYDPSPQDAGKISEADLIFYVGLKYEPAGLIKLLENSASSSNVLVEVGEGINPIEFKDNRRELARINNEWVDLKDGLLSGQDCKNSISIPIIKGSEPLVTPDARKKCRVKEKIPENSIMDKVRKILEDLTE